MRNKSSEWFIPLLLAAAAGAALWFYWIKVSEPPPAPEPLAVPEVREPEALPAPLHPVEPVADDGPERPALVPLPPLDQSDEYLKLEVTDLFGESIEALLVESRIIERIVATVDNLPRSHVAERIRPIGPLGGQFLVIGQDGSGEFMIDAGNYRRYDALVDMLTGADVNAVADLYRRYYPLFQAAYVNLGYPDAYFNDRLVEVIDHLLEAPEIADPVALVQPHVLYEYSDPDLEALSSGQKLLLRMGADHASRVKATLRELRTLITTM